MTQITAHEARPFFDHPSQRRGGMLDPEALHDNGLVYFANGFVCLAFHTAFWPGVHMVHIGVQPEGWGRIEGVTLGLLRQFCSASGAVRLVAWISATNRAVIAFARRIGFVSEGAMTLPDGRVEFYGWGP
jgi:hypothetical protein